MDTSSKIENVRFTLALIGESAGLVTDAEILTQLEMYPADWRLGAAALADHLASRAINRPTSFAATGKMSVTWADRAKAWRATADSLRKQVKADDALSIDLGVVGSAQLKVVGIEYEEPEYSRPRKPWQWSE